MFKIECLVDDKRLAGAMRSLDGIVYDLKIQPVRDVAVKNGKVHSTVSGLSVEAAATAYVKSRHGKQVTIDGLRKELEAHGHASSSYSWALKKLREASLIKSTKKSGVYDVVRASR